MGIGCQADAEEDDERDDRDGGPGTDADDAGDPLAPSALHQVDGLLRGFDRSAVLERQERHGEDGGEAPGRPDQPGGDPARARNAGGDLLEDDADARGQQRPLGDPAEPLPGDFQRLADGEAATFEARVRGTRESDVEEDADEGHRIDPDQSRHREAGIRVGRRAEEAGEIEERGSPSQPEARAEHRQRDHRRVATDQLPGDLRQPPAPSPLPRRRATIKVRYARIHDSAAYRRSMNLGAIQNHQTGLAGRHPH